MWATPELERRSFVHPVPNCLYMGRTEPNLVTRGRLADFSSWVAFVVSLRDSSISGRVFDVWRCIGCRRLTRKRNIAQVTWFQRLPQNCGEATAFRRLLFSYFPTGLIAPVTDQDWRVI